MRKILLSALLILPTLGFAQTQNEPISAGSNLQAVACRVNESQTDLADTEADANFCAADKKGNMLVGIRSGTASATNPIKLEDSAAVSGDAGVSSLFVRNSAMAALTSADADYGNAIVADTGVLAVGLTEWGSSTPQARLGAIRSEDSALTTGDRLVLAGGQLQDPLTVDAASLDAGFLKLGLDGRLITTLAPAGEMFSICGGVVTDLTSTAIVPALASNRRYITSISCSNTSTVQSRIIFRDGGAAISVGAINNAAGGGNYFASFPIPIRLTSNTAFNMEMATTATSTQCCAQGYNSVN